MLKKVLVIAVCALTITAGTTTATLFSLQLSGAINIFASNAHVEFRNYDNSLLYKADIPVGTDAIYEGDTPTKESTDLYDYTFTSWDKSLNNILVDTVFYAQYQNHPREYKVTFQNYNYTTLYIGYVARGGTAHYIGTMPTRESDERCSYSFKGWDKELTNINEDTTFIAQYDETPVEYKVNFFNYDNSLLYTTYVAFGEEAKYKGLTPTKPGNDMYDYVFTGWSEPIDKVTKNLDVTAQYDENPVQFSVTFYNYDGTELYVDYVSYGLTAEYNAQTPYREPDEQYVYTFSGWDKDITNVVENMICIAQYTTEERIMLVTFYNYDDTLLYTSNVKYGREAFYNGSTPLRESDKQYDYTFSGWDRDLSSIKQDTITYATYEKTLRKYKCTFRNYDGELLYEAEVPYGNTAVYMGETPVKDIDINIAYQFVGWDKELTNITEETEFIAQFEPYDNGGGGGSLFLITFKNYDGTVIDYDVVGEGETAEYMEADSYKTRPNDGEFNDCEFYGWSHPLDNFETSTDVYAMHTCSNGYIIQYRSLTGDLLYEEAAYYSGETSYKGANLDILSKENGFIGWRSGNGTILNESNGFSIGAYRPEVFFPIYDWMI